VKSLLDGSVLLGDDRGRSKETMVARRVELRPITDDEGNRLLRIVRRSSGSVVTWRRAQMVLLSAQAMDVAQIAQVTFTSPDRVRDVLHNFNLDGFDSLYPRYAGGRPPTFTLVQRRQIKQAALSRPVDHDLPFSTWSLAKLADFLVAEGVVDDISHEGLRALLHEEGVSFQVIKTWKQSTDPDFEAKKNRILQLYGLMDGTDDVEAGDPRWSSAWTSSVRSTFNPPRPAVGEPRWRRRAASSPAAGDLHPPARGTAPAGRLRPFPRQAVWPHQAPQAARGVSCLPAVSAQALPAGDTTGHRAGQLQPAPVDPRRPSSGRVGGGQQRRARLHPDQRVMAEPDPGSVPGAALLHPGRHRPCQPPRAGQHDPPLHRLAEPQRPRSPVPQDRRQGKGCLTRH
jgi:transposase